jgi:hypothetical protein
MRGLHYGQELVSTNRSDTFAQTKPHTTTILLAISRRTIQFPWPALGARSECEGLWFSLSHKVKITAKARFGNKNNLSEMLAHRSDDWRSLGRISARRTLNLQSLDPDLANDRRPQIVTELCEALAWL